MKIKSPVRLFFGPVTIDDAVLRPVLAPHRYRLALKIQVPVTIPHINTVRHNNRIIIDRRVYRRLYGIKVRADTEQRAYAKPHINPDRTVHRVRVADLEPVMIKTRLQRVRLHGQCDRINFPARDSAARHNLEPIAVLYYLPVKAPAPAVAYLQALRLRPDPALCVIKTKFRW